MCGLFGIIPYDDKTNSIKVVIEGLKNLQHRGYDSCGIAYVNNGEIEAVKAFSIKELEEKCKNLFCSSACIGHTRWATQGEVSLQNTHPIFDHYGEWAIVHNGNIENLQKLKERYTKDIKYETQTDTELFSNMLSNRSIFGCDYKEDFNNNSFLAINNGYRNLNVIFVYKNNMPLVSCKDDLGVYVSSDPCGLKNTNAIEYYNINEIPCMQLTLYNFVGLSGTPIKISNSINKHSDIEDNMFKEIQDQGKIDFFKDRDRICGISSKDAFNITIIGQGSSYNAGLCGKYIFESLGIKTQVEYGSEFAYRDKCINDFERHNFYIFLSQSGETFDTINAFKIFKNLEGKISFTITNTPNSTLARIADWVVNIDVGEEVGVASTKTFTGQFLNLYMLAQKEYDQDCENLSNHINEILNNDFIKPISEKYKDATNMLILGRGIGYPIALEGALKLKEVSQIHAEALQAAEIKHGPIALIDKNMPTIVLALEGTRLEKIITNIKEIKARGGKIITVTDSSDKELLAVSDDLIKIPQTNKFLSAILANIPLQLMSYYIAKAKGLNVDRPRNLAKTVTVE